MTDIQDPYKPIIKVWNEYYQNRDKYNQWKIEKFTTYDNGDPITFGPGSVFHQYFTNYTTNDLIQTEQGCVLILLAHPRINCVLYEDLLSIKLTPQRKHIYNCRLSDLFMGLLLLDSEDNPATATILIEVCGIKIKYNTTLVKNIPIPVFNGTFFPAIALYPDYNSNLNYDTSFTLISNEPITVVPIFSVLQTNLRRTINASTHIFNVLPDYTKIALVKGNIHSPYIQNNTTKELINNTQVLNVPILTIPWQVELELKKKWISHIFEELMIKTCHPSRIMQIDNTVTTINTNSNKRKNI
jgi:hypothetical protein